MSKKPLIIIGLAAVIAVSTGVITLTSQHKRGEDRDPVAPSATVGTEQPSDSPAVTETTTDVVTETAPTDAPESTVAETTAAEAVPTDPEPTEVERSLSVLGKLSITRVVDHSSGNECSAREVLGSMHNSCYLAFGDGGRLELYINPSLGVASKGSYTFDNDSIFVTYDDGTATEFRVIYGDSDEIGYIVVNHGDYDIYFG